MPLTKLTRRYFVEMKNQKRKSDENSTESKVTENVSAPKKFRFKSQQPSDGKTVEKTSKGKTV